MSQNSIVREPIAVVGVACRFPGEATSPSKLWDLVCEKRDVQKPISSDRFNSDAFYNSNGEASGCTDVKRAYLLSEDIRLFDASFFRTNALEAEAMDPQQRLLLETVYEAIESAGLPLEDLKGSDTAVYVGSMTGDYHEMLLRDPQDMPKYMATGTARSILSNRLSYFFDWKGPSMTIDTACSSSLVAVHEAVTALRLGVSTIACAAGANLILGPEMMISESNLHMLSPTGRSRMWDASANGYGRGEGTAAVIMKTLLQALKDGDYIHGIIRETGVNSDGRTNGITLPSSESQTALIRQTYKAAGIDLALERCQFFEAHGTGTPAGDPIEARAIYEAFFDGEESTSNTTGNIYVGSVKSTIGHLEGCAGLAGLIKTMEAVRRGTIPPNMGFKKLNPKIERFSKNLIVPTEALPWPELPEGTPRRASVNSFGFGGTNAHAIIENFEAAQHGQSPRDIIVTPVVLSANSEKSLREQAIQLNAAMQLADESRLRDIMYTLSHRRSQLPLRTFFVGHSAEEVKKSVKDALAEDGTFTVHKDEKPSHQPSRILGVFTGQGAQWPTMGREILKESKFAQEVVKTLEQSLASLPEPPTWTLSEQIFADAAASRLSEAEVSQPLCTAVQLMLVEMLRAAGIQFSGVIGHSSGEIAAAYCAGFLSASDAIRVAYYRGVCAKLAKGSNGKSGAMMAVGLSYEEALQFCNNEFDSRLDVAASNAPASTTISGDEDAIQEAKALLDQRSIFARVLKVDTAYHSHHMLPCAGPYSSLLKECGVRSLSGNPACEWYSSVICERIDGTRHDGILGAEYWRDNMVNAVKFSSAAELAIQSGEDFDVVLEVGPHPALKGPFEQTVKQVSDSTPPYQATLMRNIHDIDALSKTLGFLWSRLGKSVVDFSAYAACFDVLPGRMADNMPTYPWDHGQSFWKESRKSANFRLRTHPPHPLLGVRSSEDMGPEMRWLNILRVNEIPWLEGHKVQGQVIYPAAAYLVMAMEAAKAIDETKLVQLVELYDVRILSAIQLAQSSQGVEISFSLNITEKDDNSSVAEWACYTSSSTNTANWKCHAKGHVRVEFAMPVDGHLPPRNPPDVSLSTLDMDRFYECLTDIGLQYSLEFRSLSSVQRRLGYATASVSHIATDFGATIHPALLDSSFQSLFAAYCWPGDGTLNCPFVPTYLKRLRILNIGVPEGEPLVIDSYLTSVNVSDITCDIDIALTDKNKPFVQLEGLTCTSLLRHDPKNSKELYTRTEWEVDVHSEIRTLEVAQSDEQQNLGLVDLCERFAYYYLRNLDRVVHRKEVETMEWHYQRVFEWIDYLFPMIEMGKHPTIKPEWSEDQLPWLMEQKSQYPDQIDLMLIQAVGENLPAVVRKQTTMLEHMVKDDVLNRFYKEGLGFQRANGYMSRISRQIAHRYPRMNILEIGAGTGGATKGILQSLGSTFGTYTFTDVSTGFFEAAAEQFSPWADKMVFKALNIENSPTEQGYSEASYDLVIASNVLHATKTLSETMRNVRRLLKPGGFLLLLEVTSDIVRVKMMMSGLSGWWLGGDDGRRHGPTITVPEWDTLLRSTGFSGVDNTFNDFGHSSKYMTSVMLSQAMDERVEFLRQPLSSRGDSTMADSLTIVGGTQGNVANIIARHLADCHPRLVVQCVAGFEDFASPLNSTAMKSLLVLQDLDEPVLQKLASSTLGGLQKAIDQCRQVLWVSSGCRKDNPFANMSVGLCRSLSSEYPHIKIQHIDVETRLDQGTMHRISEAALRLLHLEKLSADTLWSFEPELILEDKKWYIPRLVPDEKLNQRLTSTKMAVQVDTSLKERTVEIVSEASKYIVTQSVPCIDAEQQTPLTTINVTKALLHPVATECHKDYFLCYGYRDSCPDIPVLALATANASSVSVPEHFVFDLPAVVTDGAAALQRAAFSVVAEQVLEDVDTPGTIFLHNEDQRFSLVVRQAAAELGLRCIATTSQEPASSTSQSIFIHPHASQRVLKALIPQNAKRFIDFSTDVVDQSRFRDCLPPTCRFYALNHMVATGSNVSGISVQQAIKALTSTLDSCLSSTVNQVSISELHAQAAARFPYGTVVDFVGESTIARVPPLQSTRLFRCDKTYLLAGCTGGFGKALCRWMVASGVRHLALTTRNISAVDEVWVREIERAGACLKLYQVDVSDKNALQAVYEDIGRNMPPVVGVANAAMVLSDKSFGELKTDNFDIVFGPKVRGTQNLHDIFKGQALDFFIMFSSLASVVGNRGQSNYAAANLFMTTIAEQRRASNLAASVIHIGMVLGVGYVSSTGTYENTLRQYNYMPISESDFLNMFSQAILIGHPRSNHPCELITGLNRYSLNSDAQQYFWHENMRFSHHYIEEEQRKVSTATRTSVSERLEDARGSEEILAVIEEEFCTKLERMLQAEAGTIKASQSLANLGVDSLVAVEIRSWFFKEADVDIPVLDVLNTGTISELCQRAAQSVAAAQLSDAEECAKPDDKSPILLSANIPESNESTAANTSVPHSLFEESSRGGSETPSEDMGSSDISLPSRRDFEFERCGRLSFAQERLWFLQKYLQDPTTYNVSMAYKISGPLRRRDFEDAFEKVIQRHASLRTGFYVDADTSLPMQRVYKYPHFRFTHKEGADYEEEYHNMQKMRYDLESGDVISATIIRYTDQEHVFILGFHHIAMDGFSAQILVKDLIDAYGGLTISSGCNEYLDYAIHQRDAGIPVEISKFWMSEFNTLPPVLPLFDFAECKTRTPLLDYKTKAVERTVPTTVSSKVKILARQLGATPFHIYLAALQALLYDINSNKDICIGITDANKTDPAYLDTIGFFVNLVPIRFHIDESEAVLELVARSKKTATNALSNSMPFDVLLDDLQVPRSTTHSPLFQVILNYKMGSTQTVRFEDCEAEILRFPGASNAFDLAFDIGNFPDGSASISLKTQAYMYTDLELRFILDSYIRILSSFVSNPSQKLHEVTALSEDEKEKSLQLGRGRQLPDPRLETVAHFFEDWALTQPLKIALREDSGAEFTYRQIQSIVNAFTETLHGAGLGPGSKVCVYCEPGTHILAALLAISKIGGIYIPLDPQNPTERLQLIVNDCEPDAILCDDVTSTLASLLKSAGKSINVTDIDTSATTTSIPDWNKAKGDSAAFVFYTSGTTGVPKGIALTHSNVVHHINSIMHFYSIKRGVVLQQAPLGFDMSLTQMTLTMMTGGTLVVASSATRRDPRQIASLMYANKVTHTFMTPTLALALIRHGYDALARCSDWEFSLLSGEAFRAHVVHEFRRLGLAGLKLYNGYGPTEITINSSSGMDELDEAAPRDTRNPSIGATLPNYTNYILDKNMQPVRIGNAGELFVGGAGIALGYLRRDKLNKEKFLPDPFASADNRARGWCRMYRTGDKAKFLPDGRIVFLGRIQGDSQVKLRGFRIELVDISNTIIKSSHGNITEAGISLRRNGNGSDDESFLVAFAVVSHSFDHPEPSAFFKKLLNDLQLPRYMIPAKIVPVDRLPMSSSGKLDQNVLDSLPVPKEEESNQSPLTDTQERLKKLWVEALPPIGATAVIDQDVDFFQVGGNSLRIILLRESISREFCVSVSVFDLFANSTLGRMAARIDESTDTTTSPETIDWNTETLFDVPVIETCEDDSYKQHRATSDGLEIILTGATGFLGSAILASLVQDARVSKVHCVAIRQPLKSLTAEQPIFKSPRVSCYAGDLSLPRLGLSTSDFTQLSANTDKIIHNGADVSFLKSYQSLRATNVGSTKEIVRMAALHRIPIHFISTGGLANLTNLDGLPQVSVSSFTPPVDGSQGYIATKWASEVYLENVVTRLGIPVWIHRPSNITGIRSPSVDLMQIIFKYSEQIKAVPEIDGWKGCFDFVPVETVARGIVCAIHEPGVQQGTRPIYRHHCGRDKIPVTGIREHLETKVGARIDSVGIEEWLSRAQSVGLDDTAAALVSSTFAQSSTKTVPWLRSGD
uniref:Hybrid PKS-NRPS protein n=1 Tax=Metarhizium anisopliae TaxID=5530 RepID=C6KDY5_METAN|nr:hybrid PKS-NRPS protein [Metarhizium anisopliae]